MNISSTMVVRVAVAAMFIIHGIARIWYGAVAPFGPFRGLAAFYLAVHWRLRRDSGPKSRELADASGVGRSATGEAHADRR